MTAPIDTPDSLAHELSHTYGEKKLIALAFRAIQLARRKAKELVDLKAQREGAVK